MFHLQSPELTKLVRDYSASISVKNSDVEQDSSSQYLATTMYISSLNLDSSSLVELDNAFAQVLDGRLSASSERVTQLLAFETTAPNIASLPFSSDYEQKI